ncbi:MAG: addiction module toxin RelE [Prevotella sp.]|jgi:mRNA-degrading endonuclease RelE of RelBE toxin-antitoxin system|nr:addiction module toxin RelE [Prevotella sp.]
MVTFDYLPEFEKRAKDLARKYKSFESDYESFLNELEKNPFGGESLGHHIYKNRMSIASKGKGKSGGARVITYNLRQPTADEIVITLMSIYDKSEISNISDAYLRSLIQEIESK